MGRPEQASDSFYAKILLGDLRRIEVNNNSGNAVIDSPGTILAKTVNVKTTHKTVKVQPATGTMEGANQKTSRYIQHLINRCKQVCLALIRRETQGFSYDAIFKNIETNFGAPWRMLDDRGLRRLSVPIFNSESAERVWRSQNAAKGIKAFSSFRGILADGWVNANCGFNKSGDRRSIVTIDLNGKIPAIKQNRISRSA